MRAVALFLSVCVRGARAAPGAAVETQDKKEKPKEKDKGRPDYAKLIVGKWEGAEGFILEFKGGKLTQTNPKLKDYKPQSGPYKVKGKTITSTLDKVTQDQEIVTLDDKELKFRRSDGVELSYKRLKK